MITSTIREIDMVDREKKSEHDAYTDSLPQDVQEESSSSQSAQHEVEEQQPASVAIQIEVDLGEDLGDFNPNEEKISALRGINDDNQHEDEKEEEHYFNGLKAKHRIWDSLSTSIKPSFFYVG